ncbi:MAG TPA: VIT domain-containing protein [Acidimicrobiia bacterium]|nr:VIT domain-containing protein [Acidimicrobiia bacterium]
MTPTDPAPHLPSVALVEGDEPAPDTHLGRLEFDGGHLPLTGVDVTADLVGLYAEVTVVQHFHNPHSEPIEAIYVFPLPDRASVHACVAELGGRRVVARLKERAEARQEYLDAVGAGKRAALAEEDRPEVFSISVGNVGSGEDATITLELSMQLAVDDDEATFRFPLVVAPRYVPGAPIDGGRAGQGVADDTDAVPDASRVTPPLLADGADAIRVQVRVRIDDAGLGGHDVRSTLHAARVAREERATVLDLDAVADRDVVIRYRLDDTTRVSALADGGVMTVNVVAPSEPSLLPRDVAVVLDRSGSMGGWKIVAARRAAGRIVDSLGATDRVWVAGFDNVLEHAPATPRLTAAVDRVRYRSVEFLARLDARGGTELAQAILGAADVLGAPEPGRDRILVLVTDGQASDEDRIVRTVADSLRGASVITVGIDEAVNAGLLRRLAAGSGMCELVESEDRLDDVLARVVRRVAAPSVTDLALAVDAPTHLVAGSLAPSGAVDAAPGARCTLAARFTGSSPETTTVTGTRADGSEYREVVAVTPTTNLAPRRAWARMRLRDLEDDVARGAGDEDAIVVLSLAEGVLCRYTAFVAVDEHGDEVTGPTSTVVQPVSSPRGWAMPMRSFHVGGVARDVVRFGRAVVPDLGADAIIASTDRKPANPVDDAVVAVLALAPDPAVRDLCDRILEWRLDPASAQPEDLVRELDTLLEAQRTAHGDAAPIVQALERLRDELARTGGVRAPRERGPAFWRRRSE